MQLSTTLSPWVAGVITGLYVENRGQEIRDPLLFAVRNCIAGPGERSIAYECIVGSKLVVRFCST